MGDSNPAIGPLFVAMLVTIVAVAIGFYWVKGCKTMPYQKEGFGMVAKVTDAAPDCIQSLGDGAYLYDKISTRTTTTEEGPDDLREMKLLLSKLACFKKDLVGAAQIVNATRAQPFSTAHDMEPVAETTARCFSKTIPKRDLELALEKWGSRGTFLLKRICTAQNMSEADHKDVMDLFGSIMYDVSDVALGVCCNATAGASIAGQPVGRMVGGAEPPALSSLKPYEGYY